MKKYIGFVLVLIVFILAYNPGSAQAQTTATPIPIVDYVEIQDGEFMAIDRTVSFGDMAIVMVGLTILTTLFIYVAYRLVVDKLP